MGNAEYAKKKLPRSGFVQHKERARPTNDRALFGLKTALSLDKENSPIVVSANHATLTE
jgi:hypothetical protein